MSTASSDTYDKTSYLTIGYRIKRNSYFNLLWIKQNIRSEEMKPDSAHATYINNLKRQENTTFVVIQYLMHLVTDRPAWFPEGKTESFLYEDEHRDGPYSQNFADFLHEIAPGDGFAASDYDCLFKDILFFDETPKELETEGPHTFRFATFDQIKSIFGCWWTNKSPSK